MKGSIKELMIIKNAMHLKLSIADAVYAGSPVFDIVRFTTSSLPSPSSSPKYNKHKKYVIINSS